MKLCPNCDQPVGEEITICPSCGSEIGISFLAWFHLGPGKKDSATALERFANEYSPSVAFLLVEHWLESGDGVLYRNRAEGSNDRAKALRYYKEALGSFLDDWLEYDFARERLKKLRAPSD